MDQLVFYRSMVLMGNPVFFYIGSMHFGSDMSCSGEGVIRQLPCHLPSSRPCHVTNAPLSPAHDVAHPDVVQQNIAQPGDSTQRHHWLVIYCEYMVNIHGYYMANDG